MTATVNSKITATPDSSVVVLAKMNKTLTLSGIISETSFGADAQYILPAYTLGVNDSLRITSVWGQPASQAGAVTTYIKFGAGYLLNNIFTAADSQQTINYIHADNSLSAQKSFGNAFADCFKETGTPIRSYSEDTTADILIDFAGALAAVEDLTLESYLIELIKAP